ncbi:AAA family ATPase [Microbacterium lacticum]
MRLHTLELTGFGPFRETQRVDFDAFGDDGVFLISGRTGAGKSSILDGVSFALYGTVPRYDGGEKRLRSDHSALTDPTEVRLEFTIGDTRWRVTRSPEYDRPAKRGGGLTTEIARAVLEEQVDGVWVGRAAKPRDVGVALGEMLGLGAQQFQQVILLAQNKFSRFLLAPGDERQTLLRALFGTRRFEQYRDDLEQRRREAQKTLAGATTQTETLLDLAERMVEEQTRSAAGGGEASGAGAGRALGGAEVGAGGGGGSGADSGAEADVDSGSDVVSGADSGAYGGSVDPGAGDLSARRAALIVAVSRADYRIEQAAAVLANAEGAHRDALAEHGALVERDKQGRERAAVRTRLAELEARAPERAVERERLERARAAEALRAPIDAVERADTQRRAAEDAAAGALAEWTASGGEASIDIAARIDELTAELARWEDAGALERAQVPLLARRDAAAAAVADADVALAQLDAQLALIPAQARDLDDAIAEARAGAARQGDLRVRRDELAVQHAAAGEAAALAERSAAAEQEHHAASIAAAAAAGAVTELLQRRLAGHAGELAAALVDGEPCAVCGATAHPAPATGSAEPVTDEDLSAAEQERERAGASAVAAADAARALRDQLAAARARAGGNDLSSLVDALASAESDLNAADAAVRDLEQLIAKRAELDELTAAAQRERAARADQRGADREEHAAAAAEATRAETVIAAARGDHASVAARIEAGAAERVRAERLADSRAALAERRRAEETARADCDARLAGSGFPTIDAARAALLPAADVTDLEERLARDAADLTATRARLLDLEISATGDDVTAEALADSAARLASADTARSAAIAALRGAELAADALRDLSEQVDEAAAQVEEIADRASAVTRLADTVAGRAPNTLKMDLETFVLAAELEEIVAAANVRLTEMSSGRYTLHHSDARAARGRASGLGIEVLDAHTGRLRSPQSLSGGETFLASLALALGLGEVVTSRAGGIRLDTLFVDEGFGSLDPETLELAMRTLDELRAGGRTVGVISHVEAMKEQLPAQLVVEATPQGPSIIRQAVAADA